VTDRYSGFVVVLGESTRADDAEGIIEAIKHIRGVVKVTPVVEGIEGVIAREQAKHEIKGKLYEVLGL